MFDVTNGNGLRRCVSSVNGLPEGIKEAVPGSEPGRSHYHYQESFLVCMRFVRGDWLVVNRHFVDFVCKFRHTQQSTYK